jgi:hypothetical protein
VRRTILIALAVAGALAVSGCAARSAASETATPAAASTGFPASERALERGLRVAEPASLASRLAAARLATARYATNLHAAKADGYQIITRMIPDMGWHFLNPTIQGFDVIKPPILVYERHGRSWQLGALEWVFTETPATPPLPGATYGSFPAACHYKDGTFVAARVQELCPKRSPQSGARFNFWHPDLVTLHVWLWYPNPDGLYNGTNPYIQPFNHG